MPIDKKIQNINRNSRFKTICLINITKCGHHRFASMSLRSRLLKALRFAGFKDLILLDPNAYLDKSDIDNLPAETLYFRSEAELESLIHDNTRLITFNDDTLYRDTFLNKLCQTKETNTSYVNLNGVQLVSITDKNRVVSQSNTIENDCFHIYTGKQSSKAINDKLYQWLTKETDGITSRYLNRPISNAITKLVVNLPLSPFVYTFGTAVIAVFMCFYLFSSHPDSILIGGLLYHAASVFDGVDGELARIKYQTSELGARADTFIDMATNVAYMAGLGYSLSSLYGDQFTWISIWIVLFALSGVSLMTLVLYFGPKGGSFDVLATAIQYRIRHNTKLLKIFTNSNYLFKRDTFALLFAIMGVLRLETTIPYMLLIGVIIWNLAILANASHIISQSHLYRAKRVLKKRP